MFDQLSNACECEGEVINNSEHLHQKNGEAKIFLGDDYKYIETF